MPRLTSALSAAVAGTFFLAAPLCAQRLQHRQGMWLGGGLGASWASIDCRVCTDDAELGFSGALRIGGTPSPQASAGVELSYWRPAAADTAREYWAVMALLDYSPSPRVPVFIRLGFGAGRYAEERVTATGGPWGLSAHGFVLQAGAGYTFPLAGRFRIAPGISYVAARGHKAKLNQIAESRDLSASMIRIGADITWR